MWWSDPDPSSGCAGKASIDIFGIFDGHGGKQAATYASRHMTDLLVAALNDEEAEEGKLEDCAPQEQLHNCGHISEAMSGLWESQDQLIGNLPMSMTKSFEKLQSDFFEHNKVSQDSYFCTWSLAVAFLLGKAYQQDEYCINLADIQYTLVCRDTL